MAVAAAAAREKMLRTLEKYMFVCEERYVGVLIRGYVED